MTLFAELRRRHVFRVGLAYLATAWLVLQLAALALGWFAAPAWIHKALLVIAALGFPFSLVFAWAYELTPEGLRHESEVDPNRPIVRFARRRLDFYIIGVLVVLLILAWLAPVATLGLGRGSVPLDHDDHAAFKREARAMGLDAYWRENGFPPQCRPLGDDDFDCEHASEP